MGVVLPTIITMSHTSVLRNVARLTYGRGQKPTPILTVILTNVSDEIVGRGYLKTKNVLEQSLFVNLNENPPQKRLDDTEYFHTPASSSPARISQDVCRTAGRLGSHYKRR